MAKNLLREKLKRIIQLTGPISIAEYFHICMADPEFGYYKNKQAIGAKADFITAPEISQMFGELIGAWAHQVWSSLSSPNRVALVELGPGKGTLMCDLLRTAKAAPDFYEAADIYLVETSALMRTHQEKALSQFEKKITWLNDVSQLPNLPTIIIANEFFDVVPIRQFVKSENLWRERGVGLDEEGKIAPILLAATLEDAQLPESAKADAKNEPEGTVFETSPAREAIAQQLANHIVANQGAALYIDYGHAKTGFGDTFQALANHKKVDPFENQGLTDLTSHVDFERIGFASTLAGANVSEIITQANFLLGLGLLERAGALGANANETEQETIRNAVERLAAPDQMGNLFKTITVFSGSTTPPPF